MSNVYKLALELHEKNRGKLGTHSKISIKNRNDLTLAYTPGVAEPCRQIHDNPVNVYKYTCKSNLVAVITDGTAVLGLGDIGPQAALPVMEGKAILFKEFGDVDAIPICLDTKDTEEIIRTCKLLAPGLGGINLEDISAPRCIEIETRLKEELDIPVFHDDQHGTAIVVVAGLINAAKVINKPSNELKVVVNGCGAAGSSIIKLIHQLGVQDILAVDLCGILNQDNISDYDFNKANLASFTNKYNIKGDLRRALQGADVFIGVSAPNIVDSSMIQSMNKDSIVFAMANPEPEILPPIAKEAGARIVGSGRSDFVNQINNLLVFPGLFKGALRCGATKITEEMKMAAANGIANLITAQELHEDYIIPDVFDPRVAESVAKAVEDVARSQNICRKI